ncbi:MAG: hypothetical protein IT291_07200 [Deltaproteobacteria bacterium]|nr:hypothetical protein [Deltaproteobacteria bacterium]
MNLRISAAGIISLLQKFVDLLFTLFLVGGCVGFVGETIWLFEKGDSVLISASAWKVSLVISLFIYCFCRYVLPRFASSVQSHGKSWHLQFSPLGSAIGLVIVLISDLLRRNYAFYLGPGVRAELVFCGLIIYICALGGFGKRLWVERLFSWPTLLFSQILICILFLQHADNRLLFSDDHPSFLYRLQLLKTHFPKIPFYNTDWDLGYIAREFFPTGMLNVFFLSFLPIYFSELISMNGAVTYTYLIPYLFVFLVPWSVFVASRQVGMDKQASVLASLLALGPSLSYFEWLLKYGTLGFTLSIGLSPLAVALSIRLALAENITKWLHVVLLLIVSTLCVLWSASSFIFVPVFVYAFFRFRETFSPARKKYILVFAVFFALLNLPWIAIFIRESQVFSFVSADTVHGIPDVYRATKTQDASNSFMQTLDVFFSSAATNLRKLLLKINPIILLFFVLGFRALPEKVTQRAMAFTVLWLVVLATVGDFLKPQLELRRMIVPASFFMAILAGAGLVDFLRKLLVFDGLSKSGAFVKRIFAPMGAVLLVGAIAMSPLTVGAVYLNRSMERFVFAPKEVAELSDAIARYGGEGRTFISGFILHELGATDLVSQNGGHVAPLPMLSGKPMYATDFYHASWTTVDPIPSTYRKRGAEGIEEFLDLINATAVVTFRREWVDYCKSQSRYEQVAQTGRFRLFTREPSEGTKGYFLRGDGAVSSHERGFLVVPHSEEMVLKFRYYPRLIVDNPEIAEIFSVPVFDEDLAGGRTAPVSFVGLRVSSEAVSKKSPIIISYR